MFTKKKFQKNFLTRFLLAAGVIGTQVMSPVIAQETADENYVLEEIIVTAARREQSIQDVSGVVQTLTSEELRKDGISSFQDLQIAVPGLNISNQEGNIDIFIRGVGSANNTELGDPGAAPHINGVYIPRPRGLGSQFYDVERVEINKGPQGTLYGRNALGGTLNLITKKPSVEGGNGYFQADAQSRGGFGFEGAVDIPVSSTSAFRIAGFYKEADAGFVNTGVNSDFINSGANGSAAELEELGIVELEEAGISDDYGARVSFTSQINDRLSVDVIADYGIEGGTGFPGADIQGALSAANSPDAVAARGGEELTSEDFDLRNVRYRGTQGDTENESFGLLTKLSYDFDSFTLTGSLSYRGVRFTQTNASNAGIGFDGGVGFDGNADFEPDNFSSVYWETNSDAVVGELLLTSNGDGPFKWTAGLFGFDESQEVAFLSVADRGFCCFSGFESTQPNVDGQSLAIFGDLTVDLNDRTRLIAGLRYTDEEKSRLDGLLGSIALVNGADGFGCCVGTRLGTEGFEPAGLNRVSFDAPEPLGVDPSAAEVAAFNQAQAQINIEAVGTPGARDDLIPQLIDVANGTSPTGACVARPDNDNGFATCPADGNFSFQTITAPTASNGTFEDDYVDWRLGIEYDVSDDHLIYAKLSTGTKSGGFNDNIGTIAPTFDTESVLVYEIGSRLSFTAFGQPATFNATAFYYDYSDQVFQSLQSVGGVDEDGDSDVGLSLVNANVSDSSIVGLELEGRFNLPANISLDLFASFLDSEIESGVVSDSRFADFGGREFPSPNADLSGNDLPLVSDFELTARLGQGIELGNGTLDWQVLAKYRSDYFLTQFNDQDIIDPDFGVITVEEEGQSSLQEAFVTVNVGLGYSFADGKYRLEAFGQNIFDETASEKAIVGNNLNLRFLNEARTWGIRGITRF